MKCRLTQEREIYEPLASPELVKQCQRRGPFLFAPAGTLIEDPNCFYLVLQCVAEAADEECAARTERTPEQIAAAQFAAKRLAAGIHPDDFDKYAAGEIVGYDAKGRYIPGPNWKPTTEDSEDDEDDE